MTYRSALEEPGVRLLLTVDVKFELPLKNRA